MRVGNYKNAFLYLRKALLLDGSLPYVWGNLGALYRRAGNASLADQAFSKALTLDSIGIVTLSNLARLKRSYGDEFAAVKLEKRLTHFAGRNPYYQYAVAYDALSEQDLVGARGAIDSATRGKQRIIDSTTCRPKLLSMKVILR